MNTGGDNGQSPPLPGGEFLLSLLHKPPPRHHSSHDPSVTVRSPPIQSNGHDYIHGYAQNPNQTNMVQTSSTTSPLLSDSFQKLGLYLPATDTGRYREPADEINGLSLDLSKSHQGNNSMFHRFSSPNTSRGGDTRQANGILQFNRFADNSGVYHADEINGLLLDSSKTHKGNLIFNRFSQSTSGNPRGDIGKGNSFSPPVPSDSFRYSRNGINGLSEDVRKTRNHDIDMGRYRDHVDEINSLLVDSSPQGNWQFDRFNDNSRIPIGGGFQNSGSMGSSKVVSNEYDSVNLSSGGSNRYAGNYRNSASSNSGGSNMAVNGYGANYRNSSNLSSERSNRVSNGYESNYRHSINSSSSRVVNGNEANYRNSTNPSRIGQGYDRPNRSLNGLEADYQNSPNSSRIREGYNRALNGFDSDLPKFPNYSIDQGNISRTGIARQEVKQTPPGFSNKGTNRNCGHNVETSSNGSRNWGIKYEDDGVPPTGSALHSVSGFEKEESLSELHRKIDENGENPTKVGDSDELDVHILGSLEEEDGSGDKNQKMKRDKDYRSDTRGQRALAQWMRKSKKMIQCRMDIDMFNAPLLAIFDSLVPPEEEKMKQKQLLALLEKLVVKEWPGSRLLVYGSCANSFGVKKSDIDICLAMKDADVNKSEILLKLADILKAENLENVQALTHARVPIVKLMDPVTGISCDICVNNVLAVVNSKLLRDYAKIDGRLRQLAFIVKHWAKSRGVNETYHGTLSSYSYVLMCIHFLQQCRPAILPCLQGMDVTYNVNVENVECAFFDQVEKLAGFGLHNRENIAQLVWGFFRYWAYCHDYTHDVVSVRVGSIISKHAKDWTRRVGNDRHLICIEDPFETTHDLGRVVDKFSIKVLREEFERAAQILQSDPNPCVTLFEPYVRG